MSYQFDIIEIMHPNNSDTSAAATRECSNSSSATSDPGPNFPRSTNLHPGLVQLWSQGSLVITP